MQSLRPSKSLSGVCHRRFHEERSKIRLPSHNAARYQLISILGIIRVRTKPELRLAEIYFQNDMFIIDCARLGRDVTAEKRLA